MDRSPRSAVVEIEPPPPHVAGVTVAAGLLAAVAGYVNAITLAGAWHVPSTHVTGTATHFSIDLSDGTLSPALLLDGGLILAFIVGASVSGAVLDSTQLRIGRRYGVLLVLEALVLAGAWWLMRAGSVVHLPIVALAAGLQNAMATQLSRAIVRTTHVTGILTDVGLALGKWIARRHVSAWRVRLYLTIFAGFMLGGFVGALAWHGLGDDSLAVPVAVTGLGGVSYWLVVRRRVEPAQP